MKPQALAATLLVLALLLSPCAYGAQLNFTPIFTVSEEYNDNIFRDSEDEEEDFITRTTFGGTLEWLSRTAGAELTYQPSYQWYDDFSQFDGWTHDLFARTWYDIAANTRIELRDAFIRTQGAIERGQFTAATSEDPLVAPDIDADRLRRGLDEYYENVTILRLDHRFGPEDTVYANFRYSFRRDVDEGLDENDIWEPSIGGTYWFTNFWGAETDLRYSNRDYENNTDREEWNGRLRLNRRINRHLDIYAQYEHTTLDFDGDDVDYDVYEPTVGFNYQIDQYTRIDIGAGWYFQDLDTGGSDDGFVMNATADKVWPFRRGLVGVTLLSGTGIDDEGVEDLGFNVFYEGAVRGEYAFTPRLSVNARASYRWDDFPDRDPDRTDKTLSASIGLEYQALRWMVLNINYFLTDLTTDVADDEYTENRVVVGITLTPPQPFRLFR